MIKHSTNITIEQSKYDNLVNYLSKLDNAAIAFSGGVDSTFLLKVAKEVLGKNFLAVTVASPYIPNWEVEEAVEFIKKLGIKHKIINIPIINEIKNNPADRCYLCKKNIFKKIIEESNKEGIYNILDGTNADDTKDYRPGIKALKELNIKSPLKECKLTKEEIRNLSKILDLNTWNKPAYACLLSRIPYNQEISIDELERIEKSEVFLIEKGFKGVRVRSHKNLARIEIPKDNMKNILNIDTMNIISNKLKEFGFEYVTLDMDGYSMGSLNKEIIDTNYISSI